MSDVMIEKIVRLLTDKLVKKLMERLVPALATAVAEELEKRQEKQDVELVPVEEVARIVGEKLRMKEPLSWVNHHVGLFDRQRVGKRYLYNKNTIERALMRAGGY